MRNQTNISLLFDNSSKQKSNSMKNLICVLFTLIILAACGQKNVNSALETKQEIKSDSASKVISKLKLNPGDFIQRVNCISNENLSFAVYVPKGYSSDRKMPSLFLFDPHSDGSLPLKLYRDLADEYGYILIGSNDSKNGNSRELTSQILNSILKSAYQLLPLDSQRIYAGGFSGGARVASMLAFSSAKIQGLITCGAGFPQEIWTKMPPSFIIGIAGDGDMNLNEITSIKVQDPNLKNRYQIIRFDGKHEWPPMAIFEQAFLALEAIAIHDELIPKNANLIKHLNETYQSYADSLTVSGNSLYEAGLYDRWINSMDNLADLTVAKNTYKDLLKKGSYKQALIDEQALFLEEQRRREFCVNAIGKQDTIWWDQQMKNLQYEIKTSSIPRKNMLSRISGSLSLGCFMNLNQALGGNQRDAMEYFSHLYRLIDPTNVEAWYLSAEVAGKKTDYPQVYNYLSRAVSLGFNDPNRAHSDPSFSMMMSDPEFNQIINRNTK